MIDFEKFILELDKRIRGEVTTQERVYNAISDMELGNKIAAAAEVRTLMTLQTLIVDAWKECGGSTKQRDSK